MFFRTRLKPFTGFIEEEVVYRFVVLFAVACICLVLAGSAGAQTFSCPAGTEDMLNYFVMNYPDRADYHMGPGNANPIYSAIFPDNGLSFAATGYFVWTKGANGYPDRKSTRLNSSHANISYAVFCLKKKNRKTE